jgi:hypothetical protein
MLTLYGNNMDVNMAVQDRLIKLNTNNINVKSLSIIEHVFTVNKYNTRNKGIMAAILK